MNNEHSLVIAQERPSLWDAGGLRFRPEPRSLRLAPSSCPGAAAAAAKVDDRRAWGALAGPRVAQAEEQLKAKEGLSLAVTNAAAAAAVELSRTHQED